MKKPDLLILIAIWQFITAFIALVGIAAIVVFAFPAVTGYWDNTWSGMEWRRGMIGVVFGLSVAILFLLCFLVFAVAGGVGLMLNRGREWARIISIVHSAFSLFFPPIIGTIIGTLGIIYLVKQDVRDYFNPPSQPK
jgi:hypothetical protein